MGPWLRWAARRFRRAALGLGTAPKELSFTGALQAVHAFAERLLDAKGETVDDLYDWLLLTIACHQVGDRER